MLLAGRQAGVERNPILDQYAKTNRERVCAAARKIPVQTDVDAPPVRDRAVDAVVAELDDAGVDVETGLELARVTEQLMDMGCFPGRAEDAALDRQDLEFTGQY